MHIPYRKLMTTATTVTTEDNMNINGSAEADSAGFKSPLLFVIMLCVNNLQNI